MYVLDHLIEILYNYTLIALCDIKHSIYLPCMFYPAYRVVFLKIQTQKTQEWWLYGATIVCKIVSQVSSDRHVHRTMVYWPIVRW